MAFELSTKSVISFFMGIIINNNGEPVGTEQPGEIVKAYPGAFPDAFCQAVVLECNNDAVHRFVMKKQDVCNCRESH